jgi:hypothetical protein
MKHFKVFLLLAFLTAVAVASPYLAGVLGMLIFSYWLMIKGVVFCFKLIDKMQGK